jgi:4-hydroxy-tetrahydrodipicolinate reductase
MIRVGVFGAGGRMGAEVCRAVAAAPDMDLVAAVDPALAGRPLAEVAGLRGSDLVIAGDPQALADGKAEVAVDFTVAASAIENIRWCLGHGVHAVVGTTGISPDDLESVLERPEPSGGEGHVFFAPNFAIGAVMMMRFSRLAASWLPDAEVIEAHHASKRDSPSGTSLATVREIAAGRAEAHAEPAAPPASPVEVLPGARGAERDGVHVHSVRLPGLVAHQEVIFGGPGQTLTIRHDTTDRIAFMPGVLLAVREIGNRPGLTIGLQTLLGL